MNKFQNPAHWVLFFGLTFGFGGAALTHAAQSKPLDLEAEAKQAAQEDAEQDAERDKGIKGKYQRQFFGTFVGLSEPSDKISPEVIGSFITNANDKKPGRSYLVKVELGSKGVLEALKRSDGKKSQLAGKLRVIGPDGEAKYLIVSQVIELSPTRPAMEHRSRGGL